MGEFSPLNVNARSKSAPFGIERWFKRVDCARCDMVESSLRWGRATNLSGGASDEAGIE